jgi:hypothetical protein
MDEFSLSVCADYDAGSRHAFSVLVFPHLAQRTWCMREIIRWKPLAPLTLLLKTITWTVIVVEYLRFFSLRLKNSNLCRERFNSFMNNVYWFNDAQVLCLYSVSATWLRKYQALVEWYSQARLTYPKKNYSIVTLPITVSRRLPWYRSQVSAVRGRQVIAWAKARPKLFRKVLYHMDEVTDLLRAPNVCSCGQISVPYIGRGFAVF